MTLADSRARALQQKLSVLKDSLETWLAITASRKDPAFEIHFTQTREVDRVMEGLRTAMAAHLEDVVATADSVLLGGATLETALLAACQIWEFYRSRLAQRTDKSLAEFLRVADELAWQCYRPVRDYALGESPLCKAPPLVYLNSAWSPFTVVRNHEYEAEAVPRAFLRNADFKTALSRLPFPIVGVPWYQTTYLPDALAICHEIGHSVEADFDLEVSVLSAVAAAVPDPARTTMWKARASELFADFYGCLSVGPAYPWALANILLAEPASLMMAHDPKYPSPYARLLFNAEVLHHLGFTTEAQAFADVWRAHGQEAGADVAEVDDVLVIARHLVGGTAAGDPPGIVLTSVTNETRALRDVIRFSRPQQDEADGDLEALKVGNAAVSSDIRVLFAVATMMWRDVDFAKQANLLTTMRAACVDTRRNEEARITPLTVLARDAHLRQSGQTLAAALLGL